MRKSISVLPAVLSIIVCIDGSSPPAQAATLGGVVTTSAGQPMTGAMVTVFSADRMRKETVFTDTDGRYLIAIDFAGELTIRARVSDFANHAETALTRQLWLPKPRSVVFLYSRLARGLFAL